MLERARTVGVQPLFEFGPVPSRFRRIRRTPIRSNKGHTPDTERFAAPCRSPKPVRHNRRPPMARGERCERGQRNTALGEGKRMPERLGSSNRCPQLLEGPIRVAEHPGNEHRPELALHAGVGTRPIRELHVRIERLEPRRNCASAGSSFPCHNSVTPNAMCAPTRRAGSSSRSATRIDLLGNKWLVTRASRLDSHGRAAGRGAP